MLVDTARPFNDVPVTFGFGRLESKRNIVHCKESNEFLSLHIHFVDLPKLYLEWHLDNNLC